MSRTNMDLSDLPKHIKEIIPRLHLSKTKEYTWELYGKHKCGYESQLENEAIELVNFAKRFYADAGIVKTHFWYEVYSDNELSVKTRRNKAYQQGFHNYIELRITDPVARIFEKEKEIL